VQVRKLLVGLDVDPYTGELTAGSRLAADQALWLARRAGASLTLLHSSAADESWVAREGGYVWRPEGLEPDARRTLETVQAGLRARGAACELEIVEETAWVAITRRVLRGDIDLVLAGKRGQDQQALPPLGSLSMKLVHHCPGAVWILKPGSPVGVRRLLAATDLTPVGERVIAWAGWLAELCQAELHVVHAFQRPLAVQLEGEEAVRQFEKHAAAEAVERIRARLAGLDLALPPAYHVGFDAPTRAILEGSRRLEPDVVVLGTVSRRGVAGFALGNTAERLLGRLDRSLLTVKPEDFECRVPPG
jgi:universal stress protein E